MFKKAHIPWSLIWVRACLAPLPWLSAWLDWSMTLAAIAIPLALLSDIFDGILARRWGTVTILLRRADGWADLLFTLSYTAFVLLTGWERLSAWHGAILGLAGLRGARMVLDFWRYGRGSAYHLLSAKVWGLFYYAWLMVMILGGSTNMATAAVILFGLINTIEGMIATALIPRWIVDAPHLLAALKKAKAD